ncbi:hypothetical protein D9M72_552770 [compost metagenome]
MPKMRCIQDISSMPITKKPALRSAAALAAIHASRSPPARAARSWPVAAAARNPLTMKISRADDHSIRPSSRARTLKTFGSIAKTSAMSVASVHVATQIHSSRREASRSTGSPSLETSRVNP